jgi:hypothetical protein
MLDVMRVDEAARRDGVQRPADGDAIHRHEVTRCEVASGELVLGVDVFTQDPRVQHLACFEITEGDDEIIRRVDTKNGGRSGHEGLNQEIKPAAVKTKHGMMT